jgi:hypothetical protein
MKRIAAALILLAGCAQPAPVPPPAAGPPHRLDHVAASRLPRTPAPL